MLGYVLQVENLFCFSCLSLFCLTKIYSFPPSIDFALSFPLLENFINKMKMINKRAMQYHVFSGNHKSADWWPKQSLSLVFKKVLKIGSFPTILFHAVLGTKCRELGSTSLGESKNTSKFSIVFLKQFCWILIDIQ